MVCEYCFKVSDDKVYGPRPAGLSIRCKSCGHYTHLHEPEMKCHQCHTPYQWKTYSKYGKYTYLVPAEKPEGENHEKEIRQD